MAQDDGAHRRRLYDHASDVDLAEHLAARVPGVVGVTNNIRAADDASV